MFRRKLDDLLKSIQDEPPTSRGERTRAESNIPHKIQFLATEKRGAVPKDGPSISLRKAHAWIYIK